MMETKYTVYKVTNKINGKIYIGVHKTKNIHDSYMGSGIAIINSRNKYGLDNFEKEVLFVYDNPESAYKKEAELVDKDFVLREDTYNIKNGGWTGWEHSEETKKKISNLHRGKILTREHKNRISQSSQNKDFSYLVGRKLSEETKKKISENKIGKSHSEETKKKISNAVKGKSHPFYGKSHSEETKTKLRTARKNKIVTNETREKLSDLAKKHKTLKCPHCDKTGKLAPMKRWHFDNCKRKK